MLIYVLKIKCQKRFFIHFIRRIQVGIKLILSAISENANSGIGYREITEELT